MDRLEFALQLKELKRWQQGDDDNTERIERLKRNLPKAVAELSDYQKNLVMLHYYNEMKQKQIAEMMGVNKSTISRGLKHARQKLQKYLQFSL